MKNMSVKSKIQPLFLAISLVVFYQFLGISNAKAQGKLLPFFDDFSKVGLTSPDAELWNESGVLLNNSLVQNPPSMFVVTFDGRKKDGKPYNFIDKGAYGPTDRLESKPLDLSKLSPKDSVAISFFWQSKGNGDLPEKEDSLLLYFKNRNNQFVKVWANETLEKVGLFKQSFVFLQDISFFHADFQFAFQAVGRQSGPFDAWHLDYVYLDKNRTQAIDYYEDIAVQNLTTSLFKNYRSMPIQQYWFQKEDAINDSLTVFYNDLRRKGDGSRITVRWKIEDSDNKKYLDFTPPNLYFLSGSGSQSIRFQEKPVFENKKTILKYGYKLLATDNQKPLVGNVDFSRNDSLYHEAVLDNYFAYDDGSAEVGADINTKFGSIAIQFVASIPDTLGAVQFNFSPYFRDITNEGFLLQIFSGKNGKPNEVLHQQPLKVVYTETINGFVEYTLSKSIAVKDTFFVSWTRLSDNTLAVGLDKNSPQFSKNILYKDGSDWKSGETLNGAFLVRAVMGFRTNGEDEKNEVLALEEPTTPIGFVVFPNPAQNEIHWKTEEAVDVTVFSETGRLLLEVKNKINKMDISSLQTGLYLFHFKGKSGSFTKKISVSEWK